MTKAEQPTITQADRDAAIEYFDPATFAGRDAWLRGDHDDDPLVQAFARHRTTSLAAQDGLVERVARALAKLDGKDADAKSHNSFEWWRHYAPQARVALEAMGAEQ